MKRILLSFTIFAINLSAFAGEKETAKEKWINNKYAVLKKTDRKKMKDVGLWSSDKKDEEGLYSYFPNKNGLIVFEDKSWILLISHSSHKSEKIGDITIIRTSEEKYFTNKGHACLPIMLDSKEKIVSLKTFLKSTGKDPKNSPTKWIPYKHKKEK